MKGFSRLILLLLVFTSGVFARQTSQLLFDQANTSFEEGDYNAAMRQYKAVEQNNEASGALYLNMGITAIQLDSMGLAKYYFLKSAAFETTAEQAREALDYVNSQFSRQSASLPKLPWDKAVDFLKDQVGTSTVFITGFILILISVVLILLKWFRVVTFTRHASLVTAVAISSVLVVVISFYVDYVDHRYSDAVIISIENQVKQQPDDGANLVSLAYEGYSITIDNKITAGNEEWYYIRLGNGQYGWIKKSGAKIL